MSLLERIFVLGDKVPSKLPSSGGRFARLRNRRAIHKAVQATCAAPVPRLAWIASDRTSADELLEEAISSSLERGSRKKRLGNLILLESPRLETLAPAQSLFSTVAWADGAQHWLSLPELMAVLDDPQAKDYVIGGMVDLPTHSLTLYRGDFSRLTVPLAIFSPTGEGVAPDARDFEVIDCGQAIRLGPYEAVVDAVFYEADPLYRKRIRARMREQEKTFGASLRRLRLQRGLRQSDFVPLPERTIARIENGAVQRPHGKTLTVIADRLGVEPDAIETY